MESRRAVKVKIQIDRSIPTEYLLNNIIDEDFQAVLLPLRIIQFLFLTFKFRIKNNFITPECNTSLCIKSSLGLTIWLLICYIRFLSHISYVQHFASAVVIFLLQFDLLYCSLVPIMIYIDSALNRNLVVEIVIRQQKVLNSYEFDKKAFFLKHMIQNWLSVFSLVSIYVVLWLLSIEDYGFFDLLLNLAITASTLIFDMNIVDVTRSVTMTKNMLVAWSHVMQKHKKDNIQTMFDAYVDIITSFRLCNKVYKFSFTYFTFHTFSSILITLELAIEFFGSNPEESSFPSSKMSIIFALWNIKNLILITTLSIACENFYRTVKLAESGCVQILNDDQAAGMHKTCKNVLRLNRAILQKQSAFGVFELDAAFPLRLLGEIVSYTVVLLQFAFL